MLLKATGGLIGYGKGIGGGFPRDSGGAGECVYIQCEITGKRTPPVFVGGPDFEDAYARAIGQVTDLARKIGYYTLYDERFTYFGSYEDGVFRGTDAAGNTREPKPFAYSSANGDSIERTSAALWVHPSVTLGDARRVLDSRVLAARGEMRLSGARDKPALSLTSVREARAIVNRSDRAVGFRAVRG